MSYNLNGNQVENLASLATHLETVAIHDPDFDMNTPYATRIVGGAFDRKIGAPITDEITVSPLSIFGESEQIGRRDAMSYLPLFEKPFPDENWHSFVLRATGFSDHRNADAWQYMFGTVGHRDLSPKAVAGRIRAVLAGKKPIDFTPGPLRTYAGKVWDDLNQVVGRPEEEMIDIIEDALKAVRDGKVPGNPQ